MKNLLRSLPWIALMALALVSVPRSARTAPPPAEHHPRIRAAVRELRAAREDLQRADHDFCGHRREAVEACDRALRQLELALQCDRR